MRRRFQTMAWSLSGVPSAARCSSRARQRCASASSAADSSSSCAARTGAWSQRLCLRAADPPVGPLAAHSSPAASHAQGPSGSLTSAAQ